MSTMLVLFGAVLLLVLINVPIAVSLGIVAVVAMLSSHGLESLPNMALVIYNGATNFPLLAIPLFILAGAIMNASGISQRLIAFALPPGPSFCRSRTPSLPGSMAQFPCARARPR